MRLSQLLLSFFALAGLLVTAALGQDGRPDRVQAAPSSQPSPAPKDVPADYDGKGEKRIAFVIGNESYAAGALPTAANDAGLIAQTLQAAGFDVVGARDLDAETLRQSYGDFLKRVTDAGPEAVAFIYLSGYGIQYGNDNYYVPIGANVSRDADIPIETIRLSDLTGPLVALNIKARFMVFDAAYRLPFKIAGSPLAGGLSLQDATPGSLVAINAAPGTVAPVGKGNYGVYAQSLAAELREGGQTPDELFDRVRLRVNQQTGGAEIPFDVSKLDAAFRFFQRGKDAPAPVASAEQIAALTTKPLKDLPPKEAYTAAVARDSYESYQSFVTTYPKDPLAKRARILLAARREALTWRHTIIVDTPPAYWSYLARYPRGPHATAARLRLAALTSPPAPPADFVAIAYDEPPPPPDELVYVDEPVVEFVEPGYALEPLPPPPDYWLPPVPVAFIDLPPPPPPFGLFFLPVPAFVPLPVYYAPPPFVYVPAGNYFYGGGGYGGGVPYSRHVFIGGNGVPMNIHGAFPGGGPRAFGHAGTAAVIGAAAVGAAAVALPAAALARTGALERRGITTPTQLRAARGQPGGLHANEAGRNALPRPNAATNPGGPSTRPGNPGQPGRGPETARPAITNPGNRNPANGNPAAANRLQNGAARTQPTREETRRFGGPTRQVGAGRAAQRERFVAPRQVQRGGGPRGGITPGRVAAPRPNFARPANVAGPRPGGFGGARPNVGAARPNFGGGGPRPNFGGGGGPRPGGGGGGPRPGGGGGARPAPAHQNGPPHH